ncbi:unnamed protein product [Brassica rapa subsp. trilocularis]
MKRLTHNRTGLGYHPDGSIDMSDDWWEQRCKVYTKPNPDLSCSQLKAMSVLHSLSSIRMWSPLYKAAYKHLREAATN